MRIKRAFLLLGATSALALAFAAWLGVTERGSTASASMPSAETARARAVGLETTYRFTGGQAERDAIGEAIDAATDDMNPLVRGIARRRLREANGVIETIGFSLGGDPLIASYIGGRIVEAPADGSKVHWVDQYGDTVNVSHKYDGRKLTQVMSDNHGTRRNVYDSAGGGSSMKMTVEIRSKMLPKPVRYNLSYAKKE